jgi:ribosomal protein S1
VLDVDLERRRISLSMKENRPQPDAVSKGEERKKKERRQEKRQKEKSTFANDPFAAAFGNKKQ